MKGWKKILCIVLVILLALIAGLLWWQRNNLKAVIQAVQYSTEELEEQIQENEEALQDVVDSHPGIQIRPLTEEEKQALRNGTLSWEEAAKRMLSGTSPTGQTETVTGKSSAETGEPEPMIPKDISQAEFSACDQEMSLLIAEVYALREYYVGQLESMWAEASEAFQNLPEGESKAELTRSYISKADKMERACDKTMDGIVDRMEELVRENRSDEDIVDTVVDTYVKEKSLKKAWYMSELEEKGLV